LPRYGYGKSAVAYRAGGQDMNNSQTARRVLQAIYRDRFFAMFPLTSSSDGFSGFGQGKTNLEVAA
jgi:hypothetical protein